MTPGLSSSGTILVELLLAFQAKDVKFKTDNRFQLRVNVNGRRVADLPGSGKRRLVFFGQIGDHRPEPLGVFDEG